jgi:hypothetical protein
MSRLAFRGAVGVLAAALTTGCLGGQTGQPSSGRCAPVELSPSAVWSSTTVEAAVRAFEGTYASGLQWQAESRFATSRTPIQLEDAARLTIAYDGDDASRDCSDRLSIPVLVTLTTTESGLADSGVGELTIVRSSQAFVGSLHYESKLVRLDATLDEAAAATSPRGGFDALDPTSPGLSATFTEGP